MFLGYFSHGFNCYPQLGCNDLISDVQVYDEVMLGFSSARMIKLAEWKHKKLVKHHSLNNLNMESDFREHLSLFKEVLHDQLIGIVFYPKQIQMRIVSPFDCHSKKQECYYVLIFGLKNVLDDRGAFMCANARSSLANANI